MTIGKYGSINHSDDLHGEVILRREEDKATCRRHWFMIAACLLLCGCIWGYATNSRNRSEEHKRWGSAYAQPEPHWYKQELDHFAVGETRTWKQRYFIHGKYFGGPGYPIFVVLGGEDPLDDLLYPFIWRNLARKTRAHTIAIEHRFYGESQPILDATNKDFQRFLTPAQAMQDFAEVIRFMQRQLGCSPHRSSKYYCPVMTIGGSYPGFLSALMRLVHDDVVDMAYAASAPLYLYSHGVDPGAYYEKVTDVADEISPGCAAAVLSAQKEVQEQVRSMSVPEAAENLFLCHKRVPEYITTTELLLQEVVFLLATRFADANMDYYPPRHDQDLTRYCRTFQDSTVTGFEKIGTVIRKYDDKNCFDLHSEMPWGPHATVSAADWSGVGGDAASRPFDFQSCALLQACGFSEASMFLPRPWTFQWIRQYCQLRFDYTPEMYHLVNEFHFTNFTGVTRLLFTNGIRDGWSVASVAVPPPQSSIAVLNFPNGAHHSDLSHAGPSERDTEDIREGLSTITTLVRQWLEEARNEYRQ